MTLTGGRRQDPPEEERMKLHLIAIALLAAIGVVSCTARSPGTEPPQRSLAGATQGAADASGRPIPPADAQWTIYCYTVSGPDHMAQSRRLRDEMMRISPLRDWYLVHGERESTLYHGFYRVMNDPADQRESTRAQSDRRQIETITDALGDRIFRDTMFVALEMPDPDGPPEWNLLNTGAAWTLEIAVYKDHAERKQAAVEAVREARKMGVEAYYYHGPTASSVCIGAWPIEAIRAQESDVAMARDPSQPIAIVPEGVRVSPDMRDERGRPIKVFQPKLEPVDPTLIEARRRFPTYSVNGYEAGHRVRDPRTGQARFVAAPSQIMQVPVREPTVLGGGQPAWERSESGAMMAPSPSPATMTPARQAPGAGRLHSLGA
jgi:hypothetical protein